MLDFTVCVCTYNRAHLLERALASLEKARAPSDGRWELLLVDNNSSDETSQLASESESRLPLRYVRETRQGLSHARNRACAEFGGELLVFMDDDVQVDREWLVEFQAAPARFPHAEFFGGRVLPNWEQGRPSWLVDEDLTHLSGLIVKFDLGEETRLLAASDPIPFGASFALRRSLVERIDPFRPDLGVVGQVPGRGEEADYMGRARSAGAEGAYVAKAVSYHLVDPQRFRLGYLYRYGVEKGVTCAKMAEPSQMPEGSSARAFAFLLRGVLQFARGRGDRFRQCVINTGIEVGLKRAGRAGGPS